MYIKQVNKTEVGIYKREILREKVRKHAFAQEKSNIQSRKKETTISTMLTTKKKINKPRYRPRKKILKSKNSHLRSTVNYAGGWCQEVPRHTIPIYPDWMHL